MTDLVEEECSNCGLEKEMPWSKWGRIILNGEEYTFCCFECKARWCWEGGYPMPTPRTH